MSDVISGLSTEELAELCALADGTLPAGRRAEVEARVAASPELQEALERQRRALQAARSLEADEVPDRLRHAVEAQRPARGTVRRNRRFVPGALVTGAAVLVAAVIAALLLTGGPGAPTVADAAALATKPATGPAPGAAGAAGTRLAVAVEGISFPDLARFAGWRALGVRHGRIDGRRATVVVYGKGQRRLGYVIVAGDGLKPPDGRTTAIRGVEYRTLRLNGRLAVTWRRGGHTCVLIGDASRPELLRLASWPLLLR